MSRSAKLICITPDNKNKYYNLECSGGTIHVTYGRVGVTAMTETYDESRFDKIIKAKLKKGYKDVTHLFAVEASGGTKVDFATISNSEIRAFINKLESYAKKQVADHYNVTSECVTEKQVAEAQSFLNDLSTRTKDKDVTEANRLLIRLYEVIPRKMKKVEHHLLKDDCSELEEMLQAEQDLLDTMAQQVKQSTLSKDNVSDKTSILDALGIEIFTTIPSDITTIKERMGEISNQFAGAFRIVNKKTQVRFDKWVASAKEKRVKQFFHGSRNENWMSILDIGLLLRPTGVVITGKMFGNGIYYAPKARKSLGYTSLTGSYWAKGSCQEGFMALFDVHVGNSLKIKRHESWCSTLDMKKLKARGTDYDSLWAEAGQSIMNDEVIVYDEAQSTIKYLIQLKGK
jgi:poly [ADP-ribose] polymerase